MAGSIRLVSQPDTWELRVYVGRDSENRVFDTSTGDFMDRAGLCRSQRPRGMVAEQEIEPALTPQTESFPTMGGPTTTINDAIAA